MYANPCGNHPSFGYRTKATALNSIRGIYRRCRAITSRKNMGAAGFEPATAWSEAKHSVQTELSALADYDT
jgi:hypothetical protein